MGEKRGGKTERIGALDGLRAIAMYFVVGGHLAVLGLAGFESLGNFIFFAFTGFMAARPWIKDGEEQFASYRFTANYYLRKFMRVMPTLFLAAVLYRVMDPNQAFLDSFLLINISGPAWVLPHIALFWFTIPLVMVLICVLKKVLPKRYSNLILFSALLGLAYYTALPSENAIVIRHTDGVCPYDIQFIWPGFAAGYLCKSEQVKKFSQTKFGGYTISGLGALLLAIMLVTNNVLPLPVLRQWLYDHMKIIASGLIACVFLAPQSVVSKALSWKPLGYIGQVSMEIMFFHIPLHQILPLTGVPHFLLVFSSSVLLGLLIEKVLMHPVQRATAWLGEKTKREICFEPVSVMALGMIMVFFMSCYAMDNDRTYTLGERRDFNYISADGLKNTVRGLGVPSFEWTPIKENGLQLRFKLSEETENDLTATVQLANLAEGTTVAVSLDGEDMGNTTVDGEGIMDVSVPHCFAQDRVIDMKLVPSVPGGVYLI